MMSTEAMAGDVWRGAVGDSWASEWVRTDRSFRELTPHLVAAIEAVLPPDGARRRVLDVGCGAGETALLLAARRADLDITGLDLSDDLVRAARDRAGPGVSFVSGDASAWRGPAPFDAALSRHGVMFFDAPVAAFAHLRSLFVPGACFAFTCFAARAANRWASELAALIDAPPPGDPNEPGPFAFADAARVGAILEASGWRAARVARVDYRYVAGGGDDPVRDALSFFSRIGPAARQLASRHAAARAALEPRIADWLAAHVDGGEVVFPAAAWLWQATA